MSILEANILEILKDHANIDYDTEDKEDDEKIEQQVQNIKTYLADVGKGCATGIVGSFIYYSNTVKFYTEHRSDINNFITSELPDLGMQLSDLNHFGTDVCLDLDEQQKNELVWFVTESIASRYMDADNWTIEKTFKL